MNDRAVEAERRFAVPLLVAAALVVPAILLDDGASSGVPGLLTTALNWLIWLAFAAEAAVMLWLVDAPRAWAARHWLDLVVVIATAPLLGPVVGGVRALRLLRLLRLVRVAQIGRRLLSTDGLRDAGILVLVLVLGAGQAFSQLEPGATLGDGLYWAMTTVTTVGYGDELPTTDAAKALAVALMVVGVAFTGLLTGAIAQRFIRRDLAEAEQLTEREADQILEEMTAMTQRLAELQAALRRSASERVTRVGGPHDQTA